MCEINYVIFYLLSNQTPLTSELTNFFSSDLMLFKHFADNSSSNYSLGHIYLRLDPMSPVVYLYLMTSHFSSSFNYKLFKQEYRLFDINHSLIGLRFSRLHQIYQYYFSKGIPGQLSLLLVYKKDLFLLV